MRLDRRAVVPLLAVLLSLAAGLLRTRAEPPAYAPTQAELGAVLADIGRVRAWSALLGDDDGSSLSPGQGARSWDASAMYLVTAPDGRSGHLSVAWATLRSEAEAARFFEAFGAWLDSPAALPQPGLRRSWPTPGRTGPEPEQSRDFRLRSPAAAGWADEHRLRLLRERAVVVLVTGAGDGRGGLSDGEVAHAFERTAAWVTRRLLDPGPAVSI